tara:strand:- start:166 stop:993 length:828 start_codon:yes stop_codon:yes gene_type:complete
MPKTHSTVKHFDDIGKLYTEGVAVNTEGQLVKAATPKDIAFDESEGKDLAKDTGPKAADGFEPAQNDSTLKSAEERENSAHNEEKLSQKVEKESVDQINNSTMKEKTNKSTFDRLFEDVMGEDFEDLGGLGDEMGGEGDLGDELGDEGDLGGEMVEIPRDLAEQLHEHLMGALGGDDEGEIEDLEDAELGMGDDELGESHVELTNAPDGTGLTKQANKVSGSGHTPGGGSASADAAGQEDGGKPKNAKDGLGTMQNKNNKVGGKVTGSNKDLFKA